MKLFKNPVIISIGLTISSSMIILFYVFFNLDDLHDAKIFENQNKIKIVGPVLKKLVLSHYHECKVIPLKAEFFAPGNKLSRNSDKCLKPSIVADNKRYLVVSFDHFYQIKTSGSSFSIISYGEDNVPGGTGVNQDIIIRYELDISETDKTQ